MNGAIPIVHGVKTPPENKRHSRPMTQETPMPWTPDEQVCPRCETDLYVGRYKGTDKIDYKCHKCGWSQ